MAVNHIHFDRRTQYGVLLRQMLDANERGDILLASIRDMLVQMRDGDGSQDAHYENIVKRFQLLDYAPIQGAPSAEQLQAARAMFEEIDSAYSKTSGNGSVSNVRAARDQMYAKLRG